VKQGQGQLKLEILSQDYFRNGATYTNFVLNSHTTILTLPNLQASQAAVYAVVITNLIGSVAYGALIAIALTDMGAIEPAGRLRRRRDTGRSSRRQRVHLRGITTAQQRHLH